MTSGPLQFSIQNNPGYEKFGRFAWQAGLSDGREVYFVADTIEIADGHLLAWGHLSSPSGEKCLGLALAPGTWTDIYAASCFDGAPVSIGNLAEPSA